MGIVAISIASISILLLMLVFFYRVQQRENDNLSRITNEQRNTMVDNIFDIKLKQEQTPVFDNSAWDELQESMATKDMEWIDVNIGYMSEHYLAATVALFDTDNKLFYDHVMPFGVGIDFYEDLRLPALFRNKYKNIFYAVKENRLFAYYIYKIVSSDDIITRQEQETGYLMLVKEYTDSLVTEMSQMLGSVEMHVALSQLTLEQAALDNQDSYFYYLTLNNQYGNPVAYLYFTAEKTTTLDSRCVLFQRRRENRQVDGQQVGIWRVEQQYRQIFQAEIRCGSDARGDGGAQQETHRPEGHHRTIGA